MGLREEVSEGFWGEEVGLGWSCWECSDKRWTGKNEAVHSGGGAVGSGAVQRSGPTFRLFSVTQGTQIATLSNVLTVHVSFC